ncbi:serine hydrolase [Algoriphagus sediminis]|uniref:Serine hydrolase domain-containing protein n=1 Tax=Algoriphagus sediminis TaxID=3057113 RepID=A0ABT7YDM6_9BACT|nr:serine hydrolase domain-containing protein [Algoriphagus sediminis]MDN3204617.1 serine hydrolase domain-containing protein [Algoriphagus sediminis]
MKNFHQSFLFCLGSVLLLLGGSSCSSESENSVKTIIGWNIDKGDLDEYFEGQLAGREEKSLSLGLINNGELVYTYHQGVIEEGSKTAASDSTRFLLNSGSRPILFYFAMTLVEDGSLDLDKPLSEYIEMAEVVNDSGLEGITTRSVIANKTGLEMLSSAGQDGIVGYKIKPGKESSDAEIGLNYLMEAIMEVEKVGFDQLDSVFQQKVAMPLGMSKTQLITSSDAFNTDHQFNLQSNLIDYSKWMSGVMNGVGLSEENMNNLLNPIERDEKSDNSDLSKMKVGDYEFYTNTGLSDGFSNYVTFDRNIDWGLLAFSKSNYAAEVGFTGMLYLIVGSKINLIITLVSLSLLALTFGFFYGLYRLYKFIMS